jgi:hypothetical protein
MSKEERTTEVVSGVTVHSGSANAGHYWSLISTERDGLGLKKALN